MLGRLYQHQHHELYYRCIPIFHNVVLLINFRFGNDTEIKSSILYKEILQESHKIPNDNSKTIVVKQNKK